MQYVHRAFLIVFSSPIGSQVSLSNNARLRKQTMASSRLRPPTKVQIPVPTSGHHGLSEMTASESNARSAMAPPALPMPSAGQYHTLKHKPSGRECDDVKERDGMGEENRQLTTYRPVLDRESQSKVPRQTLAERAGQPISARHNAPAPQTIRRVNGEIQRIAQAGPKASNSFSSTHGANRGLPNPGFASSTYGTTRPGIAGSRTTSAMGHSRSKSQHHTTRPASAAGGGHQRALSQSTRGEPAPQAVQQVNHNGNAAPFLSSTPINNVDVITTYHVPQRAPSQSFVRRDVSRQPQASGSTHSTSGSSTATTLVNNDSERDVFATSTTTASSTGNQNQRVVSLCERFGKLDVGKRIGGSATDLQGEDAPRQQNGEDKTTTRHSDDRFLMPPPPLPPATKTLKHKSSLPIFSPRNSQTQPPSPSASDTTSTTRPSLDFSYVTPTRRKKKVPQLTSPTKKTPRSAARTFFASKDSLTPLPAWTEEAIERRLKGFDDVMQLMNKQMEGTTFNHQFLKDTIESQRDQLAELTMQGKNMGKENDALREELFELREVRSGLEFAQTEMQRNHEIEIDDLERKQRHEVENLREEHRKEVDRLRRESGAEQDDVRRVHRQEVDDLHRKHRLELEEVEKRYKDELNEEKERRLREVNEISVQRDEAISKIATGIGEKEREAEAVRDELRQRVADLDREKMLRSTLENKFTETSANLLSLESSNQAMRAKIDFLESDNQQQGKQFADLHKRMQEAIEAAALANSKLRAEETLRRKLHNQVQELKGNIRVFCRVRPTLADDVGPAEIAFPDTEDESKEIVIKGEEKTSALGKVTAATHPFNFDRVFGPSSQNSDVFDEISQLVQSALDGYNVCIFCYGQTGSGKTFTMSSPDGMIPRAVRQIYESATALEEKGWKYTMRGSFVEVYNENINDLLGKPEDLDKKKHEIHHDVKRCKTTITDVEIMELDSPDRVQDCLKLADRNRSVAATKANMRSSRSHSVFILTLVGENSVTGEKCEGTLNLVDLAGSERLAHSQAEGQRLKETQNINKSLSCLGDVIGALGSKGEGGHVPYRNSKVSILHLILKSYSNGA